MSRVDWLSAWYKSIGFWPPPVLGDYDTRISSLRRGNFQLPRPIRSNRIIELCLFEAVVWKMHFNLWRALLVSEIGYIKPEYMIYALWVRSRYYRIFQSWAAQPGGGQCPPLLGPAGYRGYRGRSNENDLCFYSRQSLFSTAQVTEFQLPWL